MTRFKEKGKKFKSGSIRPFTLELRDLKIDDFGNGKLTLCVIVRGSSELHKVSLAEPNKSARFRWLSFLSLA